MDCCEAVMDAVRSDTTEPSPSLSVMSRFSLLLVLQRTNAQLEFQASSLLVCYTRSLLSMMPFFTAVQLSSIRRTNSITKLNVAIIFLYVIL